MKAGANGVPDPSTVTTFVPSSSDPDPVSIQADPFSGDIFYIDINSGTVHRISYAGGGTNRAPVAAVDATPAYGAVPLDMLAETCVEAILASIAARAKVGVLAIDPPPAPIVWTSSEGRRTGNPPTVRCEAGAGRPSRCTRTLVPKGRVRCAATMAPEL